MTAHSEASLGARHPIHNWEYADEAARTGASGFVAADVGKIAKQNDNDTYWLLVATTPTWSQVNGTGTGDVTGPASSGDNAIARFDGTDGKTIQNSAATVDDSGNIATSGTVDGRDVSADGAALDSHVGSTSNPHSVTKTQVGLSSVPNLDTTAAVANEHTHSNKTQLDLVTDGDHDVRTDNPHSVTAAQAGAIPSPVAADIDMNNNALTEIKTATFNSVPTVTPSAGTMQCAFDDYQKIIGNLNNVASVTVQLNVPTGPGNYMLVLIQGGSTPSSITWATEGSHALYAPGGSLDVASGAGERTVIGLFYDGSAWYATPSPVAQVLSS